MKNLFVLLSFALTLSACATYPSRYEFQDTQGRTREAQVRDFDECLLIARTVKPSLQIFEQSACMERRGYNTLAIE